MTRSGFIRLAAVLSAALACGAGAAADRATADRATAWDSAFAQPRQGPALQLQAHFTDAAGHMHRVQMWRSGGELRRITDERLDLLATREADGNYTQSLVDRDRHLRVQVSSTNLHRIGVFRSWGALVSGVSVPSGRYRIERLKRAPLQVDGQRCAWLRVVPAQGVAQDVCWSHRLGLALAVQSPSAALTAFRVDHIQLGPVAPQAFAQPQSGLMLVNADDELEVE